MDKPWLITDIASCAYEDTVIVAIKNKRQRKEITENLGRLGDRIVDFYSQNQLFAIEDFFNIPHRLMVMSYYDYKLVQDKIATYLSTSDKYNIPPILIFGRRWRKIPTHASIIDGDDVTPDFLLKLYWEARGYSDDAANGVLKCYSH